MRITASLAIATLLTAFPAWADTPTNRPSIVAHPAGMSSDVMIDAMQTSTARVEQSAAPMNAISRRSVSGSNVDGMTFAQRRSRGTSASQAQLPPGSPRQSRSATLAATARPAGIYLDSGGQLVRLEFNVSGQTRTGGLFGTIMTAGIAHVTLRVVLQGETARVRTSERTPTFYFYLPEAALAANRSSFEQTTTGAPTSPNEFSLIRLAVRPGRREARVGRANIGGVQSGVIDRDRIGFRFDNPRPGVYSVNPDAPLQPGEYSFVMIGSGGARQARFFDFSVQ